MNELNNDFNQALSQLESELQKNQQYKDDICRQINTLLILNKQPPRFPVTRKSLSQHVSDYLLTINREASAKEILAELISNQFEFPDNWAEKNLLKNLAITLSRNKLFVKNEETKMFGLVNK